MVRKMYLTPPDIPEGLACRTLRMPDSLYWLGIFNNALLTTVDAWRWEQVNDTDLTIDEAVAKCQEIINQFWLTSECDVCLQPTGQPFIRIGVGGAVEQLGESGWESPTGDYTVPEVPARSGGTSFDQRCLAAANATNTLKILYETISDAWNGGLTNAETLSELLLAIAAIIAAAVALWAAAIIALVIVVWDIIYDTLEYVLADLWTSDVDRALECILYNCSSNTAGVVTFDYDCVIAELAAQTDVTGSLTFDQLRLFGQLVYILQFIGGDGLNLAGATTAITSANCDECTNWCYEWTSFGAWTAPGGFAQGTQSAALYIAFASRTVTHIEYTYTWNLAGSGGTSARGIWGAVNFGGTALDTDAPLPLTSPSTDVWDGGQGMTGVTVGANATAGQGGIITITHILIRGIGENPFGADNCDPDPP